MKPCWKLLGVLFLLVNACNLNQCGGDADDDPRLGEYGRVRLTGGGGCNGSTTLAVGSTARLGMEPAREQVLPASLAPRSSAPEVIAAGPGADMHEIVLTAAREGDVQLEILDGGAVYDRFGFSAEPAVSATFQASGEVFAGGGLIVKIGEVYGACGEECPLIGGDFVAWSVEPDGALTLETCDDRVALLVAGAPGEARILGREPVAGRVLVDHAVSVLPADGHGAVTQKFTVMLPDETVLDSGSLPGALPTGSLVLLEVETTDALGRTIPLAGRDVAWTVEGDSGVVEPWSETEQAQPVEGPVYETLAPGSVTLVARVDLLGATARFDLTVDGND